MNMIGESIDQVARSNRTSETLEIGLSVFGPSRSACVHVIGKSAFSVVASLPPYMSLFSTLTAIAVTALETEDMESPDLRFAI
jgi:hypothetical protein